MVRMDADFFEGSITKNNPHCKLAYCPHLNHIPGQGKNLGIELKIGIALRLKRIDAGEVIKPVFSEGIERTF